MVERIVCPGPPSSKHKHVIKQAKVLLGDMPMRENGEGARKGWENNQTMTPV